ncbi:N-acetylmuramoyl-L-alanine amidase [Chimaeribacter arupi]
MRLLLLLLLPVLLLSACQQPVPPGMAASGNLLLERSAPARGVDQRIRFLVIHYTAGDFPTALATLTEEHVSAHYLIPAAPPQRGGKPVVWQLVPEQARAWHAGASGWRDRTNLNDTSVGIELENPGFRRTLLGRRWYPFPPAQIAALTELAGQIVKRYQIAPQNVVGHADIAPQRKQDPGPCFPWQALAAAGIGAWPDPARVSGYLQGRPPGEPVAQARLLALLAAYGYPVTEGMDDAAQRQVIAAFQMHFRPADYRGLPDAESEAIARALLAQYPPGR